MRKALLILFFFSVLSGTYKINAQNPLWTDGTAFTVQPKTLELSLFRPSKYGLTKKDELSAHPLGFFVMPHLFYKRRWIKFKVFKLKFMMSLRHGLYYPYFALKLNRRLSFGFSELIPTDAQIPHTLALQNEIIISHFLQDPSHCSPGNYLITGRLGFKYAFKFSPFEHPLIYQSILYRETVVFVPGLVWYTGVDLDGHLNFMFNYFADLDFYSYGFLKNWAIEGKLGIMGYRGKHLSAFAGLKLGFSTIPLRNRFLIMPIAGISYTLDFRKRTKHGTELFKNSPFKHDNSLERDDKYYEDIEKRENLTDTIQ
jgi:hypothetical protein